MNFKTSFGEDVSLDNLVEDILAFIEENIDDTYRIIVGTDAQVHGKRKRKKTVYATVVVCHRVGKGGRFWIAKEEIVETISIKQRLVKEVGKMVEVVTVLRDMGVEALVDQENFEVHLDIGPGGKSREVIAECVGWMEGLGLRYEIKPNAWGASHVADHFVR